MSGLGDFLNGVRVIDLSQYLPGPLATQILSDMGAGVLKVEPPGGDPLRTLDPISGGQVDDPSPYYRSVNAGKTIVCLDLKSAEGQQAFETLIRAADVLVESYRPGVLARLGFGRDRLAELNPGLIHCALSGYGQTGPLSRVSGHDINYLAHAGALAQSLESDAQPPFPPVADHAAGMQAALAVLGALASGRRTGQHTAKGAYLDVSLAETMLAWQAWSFIGAAAGHGPRPGESLLNGGAACYRVYAAADGRRVTLGALEEKFWTNFCRAVDRPQWIPRQRGPLPQSELIAQVAELFESRRREEWDALLSGVDCCYHAVLEPEEAAANGHVRARGLVRDGQVGFAAWVDGRAPATRPPAVFTDPQTALGLWKRP